MPIRKRLEAPITLSPAQRTADARGTFDRTKDPYEGSVLETIGVPKELARSVGRAIAFSGTVPHPKEMRVQDLLSNVRLMDNPGDNVERTYRQRIRSPLTAIRAMCVQCSGGPKAANLCDQVSCPLWALRRGRNTYRKR